MLRFAAIAHFSTRHAVKGSIKASDRALGTVTGPKTRPLLRSNAESHLALLVRAQKQTPKEKPKTKKPKTKTPAFKKSSGFDLNSELQGFRGRDITRVHGIDVMAAQMLSEGGWDMSLSNFVSWLGLCPDNHISRDKVPAKCA